jgi:dockerin type I repeat protein
MKIPNINNLSKASQLSLLAIVILLGAVFFTINSALQTQTGSSHASGAVTYQYGNSYCEYIGLAIHCYVPTPIPPKPSPTIPIHQSPTATPTPQFTTCTIRPTCRAGVACPQYIAVGNCTSTATPVPPTPTTKPTATPTPTRVPTTAPTIRPTATVAPTSIPIPSLSVAPGDTVLSVVVGLDGIGTAGDRSDPNSGGNMSPLHQQRTITLSVFNSQNQQVVNQQGTVTYNSATGQFDGSIDVGSQITTGAYTVKIQTPQYLRGLVSGIQSLTAGQTNTLPYIALVAGDINGDNQINILDYNILMGCYSDLLPAISCTSANQLLADLNDDGGVNQFDYNLFLRELSNEGGQ